MYSTVQGSNLVALLGVIMLVLNYFKIQITQEEIQSLIGGILAIAGILLSWWRRYKQGDLKLSGVRKNGQDLPTSGII